MSFIICNNIISFVSSQMDVIVGKCTFVWSNVVTDFPMQKSHLSKTEFFQICSWYICLVPYNIRIPFWKTQIILIKSLNRWNVCWFSHEILVIILLLSQKEILVYLFISSTRILNRSTLIIIEQILALVASIAYTKPLCLFQFCGLNSWTKTNFSVIFLIKCKWFTIIKNRFINFRDS